jgi:hypothetical protein
MCMWGEIWHPFSVVEQGFVGDDDHYIKIL